MKIEDIIPNFDDMSDEELREWLRKSRLSRFTSKETGTRSEQRPAAKKNRMEKADNLLDQLDDEQLELLINMRKGQNSGRGE